MISLPSSGGAARGSLSIEPVAGLPEIQPGYSLATEIAASCDLEGGEIVAISQKAISKAEGRLVRLDAVEPGFEARRLAEELDRDPRLVELILSESRAVLRSTGSVLITETHHGLICANAGIDASNMPRDGVVALLPHDPDASARRIRDELAATIETAASSTAPAVLISDSFGRPWRLGQAETAIGCAGLMPLDDWRGREDSYGRPLAATAIAVADQIACAADLGRDKNSRTPAVIVRGLDHLVVKEHGPGALSLLRPAPEDLFR